MHHRHNGHTVPRHNFTNVEFLVCKISKANGKKKVAGFCIVCTNTLWSIKKRDKEINSIIYIRLSKRRFFKNNNVGTVVPTSNNSII